VTLNKTRLSTHRDCERGRHKLAAPIAIQHQVHEQLPKLYPICHGQGKTVFQFGANRWIDWASPMYALLFNKSIKADPTESEVFQIALICPRHCMFLATLDPKCVLARRQRLELSQFRGQSG
jgi:hypothetical protein